MSNSAASFSVIHLTRASLSEQTERPLWWFRCYARKIYGSQFSVIKIYFKVYKKATQLSSLLDWSLVVTKTQLLLHVDVGVVDLPPT
jgi:hypothetical protein